jgi:hypothetical protein
MKPWHEDVCSEDVSRHEEMVVWWWRGQLGEAGVGEGVWVEDEFLGLGEMDRMG